MMPSARRTRTWNMLSDDLTRDLHRERSMPLLIGLLDVSAVRRSLDVPMGVDSTPECSDVDQDELITKQASGGGGGEC